MSTLVPAIPSTYVSKPNIIRPILPNRGVATVKSVLSGDTVVLQGTPTTPGGRPPVIVFTFEKVTAPRLASKNNDNIDDPGAFPSREFLRTLVIGKQVTFEIRKQGASAGDRVYGLLYLLNPSTKDGSLLNLAVEVVRAGHGTPKLFGLDESTEILENDPVLEYEKALQSAFLEAKSKAVGVHSTNPLIRSLKNPGDDFALLELVEKSKKLCDRSGMTCVIEYVFDGSRLRLLVTDPDMAKAGLQYSSFTMIVAGIASPRFANPRAEPPVKGEPFAEEAKDFVESRLLQRELKVSLYGSDKAGLCAVGTPHHPRGNIAIELLKNGLARMSDWSSRLMNPLDLPAMRVAENGAKRANKNIWQAYVIPTLSGESEINGTVVEVITGDTISILRQGDIYNSEEKLKKVSLASVRAPRPGTQEKPDDKYIAECKERLRSLLIGKQVKVVVHYERDIPLGQKSEKRQFGTISVGKREDVGEILVAEGLASTQRHRDDEEKSPRYDSLVAAEVAAKAAKKGIHSEVDYKKPAINDLADPKKAKAYSGSLTRAGTMKAIVEVVLNGSRFRLYIPSENCSIIFALDNIKCPQPSFSANPATKAQAKPAEPFGDESKRHARLAVMQRTVEINCTGVSMSGVITGHMYIGSGQQRTDFGLELVGAGLAVVDQRRIDYGNAPKILVDAQNQARANRVGLWSLDYFQEEVTTKPIVKVKEERRAITLSEIRKADHFYFRFVGDNTGDVIDQSMKCFASNHGLKGAPCDSKVGKVVAALFDDGTGKSWYRAKIIDLKAGSATVLFVDWGNVAVVSVSTHLRALDLELGLDRIPAAAREAVLALIKAPDLDDDDGVDAAHYLRNVAWGKILNALVFCDHEGKAVVALYDQSKSSSVNEDLVSEGWARTVKPVDVKVIASKLVATSTLENLMNDLSAAQESARKSRRGMWRYGDVGDDDEAV